jgi:hypothetical protein
MISKARQGGGGALGALLVAVLAPLALAGARRRRSLRSTPTPS